jgi:hypothetical protein
MSRLLGEIGESCLIETPARMEGNVLVALLAPKKGAGAVKPVGQAAGSASHAS